MSNAAAFTELFCSPDHCKSTFDYYAFVHATAKSHFASVFTRLGKRDCEWLPWVQWREKLDVVYSPELRILPPFIERCDHFVENYYSWYQRRAGKMSRQTRMIRVDQTENLKPHAQGCCDWIL